MACVRGGLWRVDSFLLSDPPILLWGSTQPLNNAHSIPRPSSQNQQGRRSLDAATAQLKRMGLDMAGGSSGGLGGGSGVGRTSPLMESNPAIVNARWVRE